MTAIYHNAENLKINIKHYLNEMSALDKLYNAITNINETPRWMSQCNYLNLEPAIDDVNTL